MTQHIDKEKRKCQIFSEEERYDQEDTTSDLRTHILKRIYEKENRMTSSMRDIHKYMIIKLYNHKNYFLSDWIRLLVCAYILLMAKKT